MKVSFVITYHCSKRRPYGKRYLISLIESINKSIKKEYDTTVYIMDNQSCEKLEESLYKDRENIKYKYHYIEDQSTGGLTWAWNYGIKLSVDDNCDIIININDDLTLDSSINKFIEIINDHPEKNTSIFGPTTNEGGAPEHQVRKKKKDRVIETSGLSYGNKERQEFFKGYPLNGFALGFTIESYKKFNIGGWFFSRDIRDAWGCQEDEFYYRNKPKGLKSYIVEECFIKHIKERSWREAREHFKHPRRKNLNFSETSNFCENYL